MIKLIAASDSHGSAEALCRVVEAEPDATALLYMGDGVRDLDAVRERFPRLPIYAVQGNCDFSALEPQEGLAPFGGVLFFYTHGHLFGARYGADELAEAAIARGADVALYGHTHVPKLEYYDELALFNPGSVGRGSGGRCTYGVITVEQGRPKFAIKEVPCLW